LPSCSCTSVSWIPAVAKCDCSTRDLQQVQRVASSRWQARRTQAAGAARARAPAAGRRVCHVDDDAVGDAAGQELAEMLRVLRGAEEHVVVRLHALVEAVRLSAKSGRTAAPPPPSASGSPCASIRRPARRAPWGWRPEPSSVLADLAHVDGHEPQVFPVHDDDADTADVRARSASAGRSWGEAAFEAVLPPGGELERLEPVAADLGEDGDTAFRWDRRPPRSSCSTVAKISPSGSR
jgi:hypothetical protein